MELGAIYWAARKRWWIVLLVTLAGAIVGFAASSDSFTGRQYHSSASLIVELSDSFQGDASRFLDLQALILGSRSFADEVAREAGGDPAAIQRSVSVDRDAAADVLTIEASTDEADRAQRLAEAYVDVYVERLREETESDAEAALATVDSRISDVEEQLEQTSNDIADAIERYVRNNPKAAENELASLEVVAAPVEGARRTALQLEYEQLLAERSDLIQSSTSAVRVSVLESPSSPARSAATAGLVTVIAGAFVGFTSGIASAAVLARLRQDAIDPSTAGDILDVPVVGSVQKQPRIEDLRSMFFDGASQTDVTTIDRIAGMAASASSADNALRIGIVSLQDDTSTTSIALALAQNFLARDASVLVIDTNPNDISVSRLFGVDHMTDIPRLAVDGNGLRLRHVESLAVDVGLDGLKVVKLTTAIPSRDSAVDNVGFWRFRRGAIGDILRSRDGTSDVMLLDSGTFGSSLAGTSSFELCDVVVLAVDLEKQTVQSLSVASRRLETAGTRLVPVTVRS